MKLLESKHFIRALWVLLILLIIYVGEKVSFIFYPFAVFIKIFLLPISFAVIFYYISVPLINWMEKKGIKRIWGTGILFATVISIIVISLVLLGASFQEQLVKLVEYIPNLAFYIKETFQNLIQHPLFARFQNSDFGAVEKLTEYFGIIMDAFFSRLDEDVSSLVSFVSNTLIGIVLFPVFLFYLLVDVRELNKKVVAFIPLKYKNKGEKIITEIDSGLNAFIKGRVLVCLFLAVISLVGYTIIGDRKSVV